MKRVGAKVSSRPEASRETAELRQRLAEAEETLRAIRAGEVDAVVVSGKSGPRVFTLEGADHAYRVLVESMREGAITLTAAGIILYANQRFAGMVGRPLERVIGQAIGEFLSAKDQVALRAQMRLAQKGGSTIQAILAPEGSKTPVQISVRALPKQGANLATLGLVLTDMSEARHNEEMLSALSRRIVIAQEAERERVALELHDHVTQQLCAVLVRSQTLAEKLTGRDGGAKRDAIELRELLGQTASEVERISRELRPNVLEHLGLVAVLSETAAEFMGRTGIPVALDCSGMTERLAADTELTLYRILQNTLKNVELHARARNVAVSLAKKASFVRLVIVDDGVGFDPNDRFATLKWKDGLGLLGMRERAAYVGGSLKIKSRRRFGTEIVVRIPLESKVRAAPRSSPGLPAPR